MRRRRSIVMDYSDDGDLLQKIGLHQKQSTCFEERAIWRTLVYVLAGLRTLHGMGVLHRDLKSANVFLSSDGTARLGDLNVSKLAKEGLLYTQTGTPYYASPEVWKDLPYDHKSDIWSLGCVAYEMAALKPPFLAEDMEGLFRKVTRGVYPRLPDRYSKHLSSTIKSMLQVSPAARPSASELLRRLEPTAQRLSIRLEEPASPPELLSTIRMNRNMYYLTDRLPKPTYQDHSVRRRNPPSLRTKKSASFHPEKPVSTEPQLTQQDESELGGHVSASEGPGKRLKPGEDPPRHPRPLKNASDVTLERKVPREEALAQDVREKLEQYRREGTEVRGINLPRIDRIISLRKSPTEEGEPRARGLAGLSSLLRIEGRSHDVRQLRYDRGYEKEKLEAERSIQHELQRIYNIRRASPKRRQNLSTEATK